MAACRHAIDELQATGTQRARELAAVIAARNSAVTEARVAWVADHDDQALVDLGGSAVTFERQVRDLLGP